MRCNPAARWGPGTTTERPCQDSQMAKETQKRLADMAAERAKQDEIWTNQNTAITKPEPDNKNKK